MSQKELYSSKRMVPCHMRRIEAAERLMSPTSTAFKTCSTFFASSFLCETSMTLRCAARKVNSKLGAGSFEHGLELQPHSLTHTKRHGRSGRERMCTESNEGVEVALGSKIGVLHIGKKTHASPCHQQNDVILELDSSFAKSLLSHSALAQDIYQAINKRMKCTFGR